MKNNNKYLLPKILVLATIVFEMSSDLYLPSMPEMSIYFGVPDYRVVLTISLYMLGFSVMGLIGGSLSDHYGRRPVYMIGLILFALASIGSWIANDIDILIFSRFFQGTGAGISYVISTAMIKDVYSDEDCSRLFSVMGMAIAVSPTLAPLVGSYVSIMFGWQANFTIIMACAFFIWGVSHLYLFETLPSRKRQKLNLNGSLKTYRALISQRHVFCNSLISGFTYGSLWAWIALAPFYFIEVLGFSTQDYAFYAAVGPVSYMASAFLNQTFVAKVGVNKMLRIGLVITVLGSIFLNTVVLMNGNNVPLIIIAFISFCIGLAPVFSNGATLSLNVPVHQLGAASAVLALIEMVSAGLFSFLVTLLNNGTLFPASLIMFLSSIACVALYFFIGQNKNYRQQEAPLP